MTLTSDGSAGLQHPQAASTPHARFTVEQFHRLCEAVPELLAKGSRHTAVLHRLARAFTPLLEQERPQRFELRIEAPLDLGVGQEPEPDLALVRACPDAYFLAHPTATSTALVIEVRAWHDRTGPER